jgi:hypothetical protein
MLLHAALAIDKDIVEIADNTAADEQAHDIVHHALKRRRGITQTEGHHQVLIVAERRSKGCFPLVALSVADKVMSGI